MTLGANENQQEFYRNIQKRILGKSLDCARGDREQCYLLANSDTMSAEDTKAEYAAH
jgi:hypothetical protein